MPQPFRYRSGDLKVGPTYLLDRPRLALRIAMVIANWAGVENALGSAFVVMLAGEEQAALNIYDMLVDRGMREKVFLTVASDKLPPNLVARFEAHFVKSRKVANARNELAHGLWATLSTRPGSILLCPRNYRTRKLQQEITALTSGTSHENHDIGIEFIEYTDSDLSNLMDRTKSIADELDTLIIELNQICLHPKITFGQSPA